MTGATTGDMRVVMRFEAEAGALKADLAALRQSLTQTGQSGREAGATGAAGLARIEAGAEAATRPARHLAGNLADLGPMGLRGARAAESGLRQTGQGAELAAGSVGNLVANFNDIAVMMAAGQNPLMLALQQGTQITQVIGPMGAAGAVRALGAAFSAMISPLSLITLGSIAAGAAMTGWLTESEAAVPPLEDAIDTLNDRVEAYVASARKAAGSAAELSAEFGSQTAKARELLRAQVELDARATLNQTRSTSDALRSGLEVYDGAEWAVGSQKSLADLFDLSMWSDTARSEINGVIAAFRQLESAPTLQGQLTAAEGLRDRFREAAQAVGGLNDRERETLAQMDQMVLGLQRVQGAREAAFKAQFVDPVLEDLRTGLGQTIDWAEDLGEANALLAVLRQQAEEKRLIAEHGEDSVLVARARLKAEREALQVELKALDVSEGLKREILAAWDAANGLASVDIAATIAAALGPASQLGSLLERAAGWWGKVRATVTSAQNAAADAAMSPLAPAQMPSGLGTYGLVPGFNPYAPGEAPRTSPRPTARPTDIDFGVPALNTGSGARGGGGRGGAGGDATASLTDLRREMQALLADLDLQAAQIAEKVRAGLLTSGEGAEELARARRQTAEGIAELIPQMERQNRASGPEAAKAVEVARAAVQGLAGDWDKVGASLGATAADLSKTMGQGFGDAFASFLTGAQSAGDAMQALEDTVMNAFQRMLAEQLEMKLFTPLFGPLFDGLFSFLPFATGGVPDAPGLAAHADSVVDRPTAFAMANGQTGLMGEAGPEAILPLQDGGVRAVDPQGRETVLGLQRMGSGHLGVVLPRRAPILDAPPLAFAQGGVVSQGRAMLLGEAATGSTARLPAGDRASGGAGPAKITVNVTNTAVDVAQARVETRPGSGGEDLIEVLIERVEGALAEGLVSGRGSLAGAMSDVFGLARAPR
ncbi:phage tail length tape measure family protein [Gemmobacter denitrificans]|uniref:Phage tail length tape measure family protein n=1 Tax=Gemmobacter denitrificans TaxID=3123040 RepID=A0ABU8C0N1_9RHOB